MPTYTPGQVETMGKLLQLARENQRLMAVMGEAERDRLIRSAVAENHIAITLHPDVDGCLGYSSVGLKRPLPGAPPPPPGATVYTAAFLVDGLAEAKRFAAIYAIDECKPPASDLTALEEAEERRRVRALRRAGRAA